MDQLLKAADLIEGEDGVSVGSGVSGVSEVSDLSRTSTAMEADLERNPEFEEHAVPQHAVPQPPKNPMFSFGEKLGVNDIDPNAGEKQAQREGESGSETESVLSKRSRDDLREDSSSDGSEQEDGYGDRPSKRRLNQEFMSNMHGAKDHEEFRAKAARENHHYRYAELSSEEINVMKLDLLYKISVLNEAGFQSPKTFTIEDSLVALEAEHGRLTNLEDMQYGMQMMRYVLTNGVSVIESVNENFRLSPLRLKGWSVAVHRDVTKYNPILLELYQQHAYAVRLSPLTKLCIALCFSAASTHLANSLRSNEDDRGNNNMFNSVMNIFGAGATKNTPGRDRAPVRAPSASTPVVPAPSTPVPSAFKTNEQPTMQGPSTLN
jgi:hypothetical protein